MLGQNHFRFGTNVLETDILRELLIQIFRAPFLKSWEPMFQQIILPVQLMLTKL
jgi:hypothetical protein